ncbi:MAG: T9SS type A sorting domain-containing protein [Candidatus Zixiibacteriota bacterium]|nr:MAG: T9SS type A sorting domain-containing protein [candidate division Zixibacteria bacterium]
MKSKQLIVAIVLVLTLFGTVAAQFEDPSVWVVPEEIVGLNAEGYIPAAGVAELVIPIHYFNIDEARTAVSNGFDVACSDGADYDTVTGEWSWDYPFDWDRAIALMQFPPYFDQFLGNYHFENATGDGVGFTGLSGAGGSGLLVDFDGVAVYMTVTNVTGGLDEYLVLDSTWWTPANYWLWSKVNDAVYWGGPYQIDFEPSTVVDGLAGAGLPTAFSLKQNYPNPFNPSTDVQFDVPRHCHVNISVYNVLGQNVKTLVNEELAAGSYVTQWDGRSDRGMAVSSGVYFYKMQAGSHVETKKMIMLK